MKLTLSKHELEQIVEQHLRTSVLSDQVSTELEWKSENGENENNIYEIDLDNVWMEIQVREKA